MPLTGSASRWYYSLNLGKINIWGELIEAFVEQFSYNTMIDVTLRDLEITKQKNDETFSEYLVRWKGKASKMIKRPIERDQVNLIVKNLLPVYNNRLFSFPIMTFEQLCDSGIKIEDAINNGHLDYNEGKPQQKKTFGVTNGNSKPSNSANVSAVYPPYNAANQAPKPKRKSSNLGASLSRVLEHLSKRGHLKPLDPTPISDPIPSNWNMNEYCAYHQKSGHKIDSCQ